MPRFLSTEWFAAVDQHSTGDATGAAAGDPARPPDLVIDQVVRDTPDGEVRYRVEVAGTTARITTPGADPPDLTITADWPTASAIAKGELATTAALMTGRLRVRGNLVRMAGRAPELLGTDPVPPEVRRQTTY